MSNGVVLSVSTIIGGVFYRFGELWLKNQMPKSKLPWPSQRHCEQKP